MSVQMPNSNAIITVKGPKAWKNGTLGMTLKSNDGWVCFIAQAQCNVAPGQYAYSQLQPYLQAAGAKWKVDQPQGGAPAVAPAAPPMPAPQPMPAAMPQPLSQQQAMAAPTQITNFPPPTTVAFTPNSGTPSFPTVLGQPPAKPIITAHLKTETIYSQLMTAQTRTEAQLLENAYYQRVIIDTLNALRVDVQNLLKNNLATFTPETIAKLQAVTTPPASVTGPAMGSIDINEEPNLDGPDT